jgi:hypothetical protein
MLVNIEAFIFKHFSLYNEAKRDYEKELRNTGI